MIEPTEIPIFTPRVLDSQRARVVRALASVDCQDVLPGSVPDVVRAAEVDAEATPLELIPGEELAYWRPRTVSYPQDPVREIDLLHMIAHHLTHPAFPAHGPEFVTNLLWVVDEVVSGLSQRVRYALGRSGASGDPRPETGPKSPGAKVLRSARKRPGCLMRLVLGGPPESVLGLLLGAEGETARIRAAGGEREIDLKRVRYVSWKT